MKSIRIVIADDHDILREALCAKLAKARIYVCAEARTGYECVELAQRHQPDVVLMDFGLPGLNGVEATRVICSKLPAPEVLFLTGYDNELLAREAFAAGARGFLLKTNARDHLVPAVLSLAEHKPYFMSPVSAQLLGSSEPQQGMGVNNGVIGNNLTAREREIVMYIASGKSSKDVASALSISTRTVEAHRSNIFLKLKLHSVSELVLYAVRNQIIQP